MACKDCGLVYMPEVPRVEALSDELEWTKSHSDEKVRRAKSMPLLAAIDKVTRKRMQLFAKTEPIAKVRRYVSSGRILDLGCGAGGQLGNIAGGFVPYGIEISPVLAPSADELFRELGGSAVCASCEVGLKSFPDDFFDAAILRSYLEHEHSPKEILLTLFQKLKPGGVAIVKVPNFASWNRRIMGSRWCGFRFPDHVNYFTPHTLHELSERTGFDCIMDFVDRIPTNDNMWAVLRKPKLPLQNSDQTTSRLSQTA